MNKRNSVRNLLFTALILVMVTSACGVVGKPKMIRVETMPTQTMDIQLPLPEESASGVQLNLNFLAGEMTLSPGTGDYLAAGTATYNADLFTPIVETTEASYTIGQNREGIDGFPKFDENAINRWDFQIADRPLSLNLESIGYDGTFELGGLSLEKLSISEGGSNLVVKFSESNHSSMSSFTFNTGGSNVELYGLANANFEDMTFSSGAGSYTLRFDGDLQRDAKVLVESGVSSVNIIVPEGVNAVVKFEGGLTGIETSGTWVKNETTYNHPGSGPVINITVAMGMGSLTLKDQ